MAAISIKQLLEAGVHFGHQTSRWNPKMKSYIFGERNGIHIIDLQKTLKLFKEAVEFVNNLSAQGKIVLFVGTKSQAQETIEEEAQRCGMYFVSNRWLGGLLTNFLTVQNSLRRYLELETMREDGFYEKLSKKEVARLERQRKKLEKNFRGIRGMTKLPDAVFVVDSNHEGIAVQEASKLKIPIIAVVDTDCDPDMIDYVIPGNDDALRSVKLFAETIADSILAGRALYEARVQAEEKEAQEKAAREAAQRQAAKEAKEAARQAAEAKAPAPFQAAPVPALEKEPESEKESAEEEAVEATAAGEGLSPDLEKLEEEVVRPPRKIRAKESKPEEEEVKGELEKTEKEAPKKRKTTAKKTSTVKRQAKSTPGGKEASGKASTETSPEREQDQAKVEAES